MEFNIEKIAMSAICANDYRIFREAIVTLLQSAVSESMVQSNTKSAPVRPYLYNYAVWFRRIVERINMCQQHGFWSDPDEMLHMIDHS